MKNPSKIKKNVYNYTVLFEKNELGGYTVTAPLLPGLTTQGKNLNDARIMAEDAISCYLEGLSKKDIPIESEEIVHLRIPVTV